MSPDAERVARDLERRVTQRGINGVVFYNPFSINLGFPPVTGAWFSHPLCPLFEEIDLDDHAHKRPFRTALVINEEHTLPGEGFFKMMRKLRFPQRTSFGDQEKMRLYLNELNALAAYYGAVGK